MNAFVPHICVGIDGGDIRGNDNQAIQLAINTLPASGGIVEILPGVYTCLDAIHLKSNVRLIGRGDKTILRKCDGARSSLKIDADYGQLKITPQSTEGFWPGMGLLVGDHDTGGWLETATTILDIQGGTMVIADHLVMDYAASREGWIRNACSMISGIEVENVRVENLTVDGNKATNEPMNGCRGGAIYFHKAKRCAIQGCMVHDYAGDGISYQITQDITVENCTVTGSTNFGLHPGTGSTRSLVRRCTFSDNAVGGYFLCWRVQEGRFEDLVCERNGSFGISIGHKDTDNLFERCILRDNGQYGLFFRDEELYNGAHRNTWRNCLIENNESDQEGCAIRIRGHTHDNLFERCTFRGRHVGLHLESHARRFRTVDCAWEGFAQPIVDESGPEGNHCIGT
ncbi:MAG: right-handed parallel beta-helix repeat-containing protein [Anaerolineae bacterium]|nr:right-handed parallel beta-helix repeat-containing protein [Anaerolineae bacterium]